MIWLFAGALLVSAGYLIGRITLPAPKITLEFHEMRQPPNPRTHRRNGEKVVSLYDQDSEGA